ncbi:MAG: hypothetical protein DLM64_11260 [Solirubrobacterales bacterium]|jgi:hypothetical protein|nr:MAG: hypothetical protein DLM64_11260 [Solirubrobacterales bacterium]
MSAESTPGAILPQLHAQDLAGRDLALLRTRLYRLSDDRRHYALTEALEERLLTGHLPCPFTVARARIPGGRPRGRPASELRQRRGRRQDIDVAA